MKTKAVPMTRQVTENVLTKARVNMPMVVSQGFQPPDVDSLRIVITGRPGCGKSSFVASNPKALLFDLESNAGAVRDAKALRVEIRTESQSPADDIRTGVKSLVESYRKDPDLRSSISTVVFDTFDSLVEIFATDLRKKHDLEDIGEYKGGHGKGYFVIRDEIFSMLNSIRQVGLGYILVAHLIPKEVGDGENKVVVPALAVQPTIRNHLVRYRDLQFRMECVQATEEVKTKTGVVIERKIPGKRKFVLITDTTTVSQDFDGPKCTVPIRNGLEIPAEGGWGSFRAAYAKAIEIRRARKEVA